MTVRIPIKGEILAWARESAGYTVATVAERMKKEVEVIESWEKEEAVPTLNQLRTLASLYKRPLGVLFRSSKPTEKRLPRDFRRLPGTFRVSHQPEVIAELRAAQEKRDIALLLYEELGEEPPTFSLTASLRDDPEAVAAKIRRALGITLPDQTKWRDYYVAFNTWRQRMEALGVLVFQFTRVDSERMRGFSLAESQVPVIGVNRGEYPQARCFSLLHEFCHLLLRMSSVCDFGEDNQPPEEQAVEIFCNAVAGAALVPITPLREEPLIAMHPRKPRNWEDETIAWLAKRYKVSREVIVRRLVTAGLATSDFYASKRAQYAAEHRKRKEEQKPAAVGEKGGKKAAALLGGSYGRLVLSSYYQDLITLNEVSNYLGMKLSYLPDFEQAVGVA